MELRETLISRHYNSVVSHIFLDVSKTLPVLLDHSKIFIEQRIMM